MRLLRNTNSPTSLSHQSKQGKNLKGGDARRGIDIKNLEGLVQRAGYESVASIAECDHLHWTLVASLR